MLAKIMGLRLRPVCVTWCHFREISCFLYKLKLRFLVFQFFKVTLGYLFCLQSVKWEDEWKSFCVQFLPSDWSYFAKKWFVGFLLINTNTNSDISYAGWKYKKNFSRKYGIFPKSWYLPIHGYLSLFICILGTIFNIVNLVVLSHREMR